MWAKAYGFHATEQLCQYFNAPAATWLRVNTFKTDPESVLEALHEFDIDFFQHPMLPEAIRVDSLQPLKKSELFRSGKVIVQDLSAMLPAVVLST